MPTTAAGKSISAQNALKHGLFAATDFIRPDEQHLYAELDQSIHSDLTPQGILEHNLAVEIRRAMWRLHRCGEVESHLVLRLDDGGSFILDPMETVSAHAEKIQKSVDRARAQAHRLLHKCTAELRKLQTERQFRNEFFPEEADISHLGVADFQSLHKTLTHANANAKDDAPEAQATEAAPEPESSFCKTAGSAAAAAAKSSASDSRAPEPPDAPPIVGGTTRSAVPGGVTCATFSKDEAPQPRSSFCKTALQPAPAPCQTPRNAPCPCGSGLKHKRCCGQHAPAMLHAA